MNPESVAVYGFYLAFTLGCTFYALLRILPAIGWQGKIVKPLAAIIVAGLFWFQNTYRHDLSPEAYAKDEFEKMLVLWEIDTPAAISRMNFMASSERPWDPYVD